MKLSGMIEEGMDYILHFDFFKKKPSSFGFTRVQRKWHFFLWLYQFPNFSTIFIPLPDKAQKCFYMHMKELWTSFHLVGKLYLLDPSFTPKMAAKIGKAIVKPLRGFTNGFTNETQISKGSLPPIFKIQLSTKS